MNYRIYNNSSSEWVLLIHGLGGSINTWKYQIDDLQKYNIIAVDLEGHGGSPFGKHKHLLTDSASSINDILVKESIDKVHIISLSLGTIVALEFTYLYKEKVKSIILAGCVMNLHIGYKTLLAFVEAFKYVIPKNIFYPMFANIMMPKGNHKKSREFFIRESLKMKSVAFRMWLSELFKIQFNLQKYLDVILENKLPVFLISGQEDYFFLHSAKRMHKKISDATTYFIEKCGHVCSIENYETFNKQVLDYLDGVCLHSPIHALTKNVLQKDEQCVTP
ncbi:MAG: alpha/beta hydrolase [Lachnospiraceae bacterium]|nr:alpha/beta hydrolase [Lachnospiraceae bacterium]